MTAISGTVLDSSGSPAAGRIVRAFRRDNGRLIGQAITSDGSTAQEPYFSDLQLLMSMDGSDNGTTFSDISSHARTVTVAGNAKTKTDKFKYGSASAYFDGNGDRLSIGGASDWTWMHVTNAKWTAEAWVAPQNYTQQHSIFATSNAASGGVGIYLACGASGGLTAQIYRGVSTSFVINPIFANSVVPIDGDLHHVAFCYDHSLSADNLTAWIDGKLAGTASKTANTPSASAPTTTLTIGGTTNNTAPALAHIDEAKIYKDRILYTAEFVPPQPLRNTVLGAGEYVIDCGSYTGEVDVICLDDSGGTLENDLIHRAIPV